MRVLVRERWFTEHAQCRADLPGTERVYSECGGEGEGILGNCLFFPPAVPFSSLTAGQFCQSTAEGEVSLHAMTV